MGQKNLCLRSKRRPGAGDGRKRWRWREIQPDLWIVKMVQRVLAEWEIDIPDEVTRTSGAMPFLGQ